MSMGIDDRKQCSWARFAFGCLLALVFVLDFGSIAQANAASAQVRVTLPKFNVWFNARLIDNSTRQYPLIVYNDITYVPMTWGDCANLGLKSEWWPESGLAIAKIGWYGFDPERIDKAAFKNKDSYMASLAAFPITVNGKVIQNSVEPYPLLSFRSVTYFPLTWRFAVGEFGWDYSYSDSAGLSINSRSLMGDVIKLPQLKKMDVGSSRRPAAAILREVLYFEGEEGKIYAVPLADTSNPKVVYRLPYDGAQGGDYPAPAFDIDFDGVLLSYHVGGAAAGSDRYVRLTMEGAGEESDYRVLDSGYVKILLRHRPAGASQIPVRLGYDGVRDEGFNYVGKDGVSYSLLLDGISGDAYHNIYTAGTVTTYDGSRAPSYACDLYRTNVETGESIKLTSKGNVRFDKISRANDYLYFMTMEGVLCRVGVDGKGETAVLDVPVNDFVCITDNIFYMDKENRELYRLSDGKCLDTGGGIESISVAYGQGYFTCEFAPSSGRPFMVFDGHGVPVYRAGSTDYAMAVVTGEKVFLLVN